MQLGYKQSTGTAVWIRAVWLGEQGRNQLHSSGLVTATAERPRHQFIKPPTPHRLPQMIHQPRQALHCYELQSREIKSSLPLETSQCQARTAYLCEQLCHTQEPQVPRASHLHIHLVKHVTEAGPGSRGGLRLHLSKGVGDKQLPPIVTLMSS